jgi:hypothetical protein
MVATPLFLLSCFFHRSPSRFLQKKDWLAVCLTETHDLVQGHGVLGRKKEVFETCRLYVELKQH